MKRTGILFLFILIFIFLLSTAVVNASINSNEARVIGAASGTFSYNGVKYVATSSSLGKLKSYLNQSNINLTSSQASKAIGMMYDNVRAGVEDGHIVPVSGSAGDITVKDPEKKIKAGKGIVRLIERDAVVKVTSDNGDVIYSAQLPIKNTGFNYNGLLGVAGIIAALILVCALLIIRANLFDCKNEAKEWD